MQRYAKSNEGNPRKLPFFVDPLDGKLKIAEESLVTFYKKMRYAAEREAAA